MTTSPRRRAFTALVLPLALLTAMFVAVPASATVPPGFDPGAPPAADPNPAGPETEATIIDMIDTSGLFGGTVPAATATTPYPSSGLQNQRTVTTAQIILDDATTPAEERIPTYCIDLDTETTIGIHYELGDWTGANVPNLDYVQWILENYYPNVPAAPAGSAAEKVRAVQGAIWYFTDQFVVAPAYATERNAVRSIVEAAQAALAGPIPPQPDLPTLTLTPAAIDGIVPGELVGPFTVGGNVGTATISIPAGTNVFADATGTIPVTNGDVVTVGDQLWAEYDPGQPDQGFTVRADAIVPVGNVFLYDGNNPPRTAAQKLVLATVTQMTVQASASVTPEPAGTLQVTAVIDGAAAGSQQQIALEAACAQIDAGWQRTYAFQVPALRTTPATFTVTDVPDGATCTLTQTADGATADVLLTDSVLTPAAGTVTIVGDATSTVEIANTYDFAPGDLRIDALLAGPGAGQQGEIVLLVDCVAGGSPLPTQEVRLPAGTPAGSHVVTTLTDIAAGAVCTVRQSDSGANADVALASSTIVPDPATIAPNATATVIVSNVYSLTPSPSPTPTPSPTVAPLPPTGGTPPTLWMLTGLGALVLGIALVLIPSLRRRRS